MRWQGRRAVVARVVLPVAVVALMGVTTCLAGADGVAAATSGAAPKGPISATTASAVRAAAATAIPAARTETAAANSAAATLAETAAPAAALAPTTPAHVGTTPISLAVKPPILVFDARPERIELGRRLFHDVNLSEPRGVSCASCHDAGKAFAGGRIGGAGVAAGSRPGHFANRAAPSLLYVRYTPALYFYQDDDANAPEPRGGLFADGRADRVADAVASPFLHADEMNNRSPARLAARLVASAEAGALRQQFGQRLFDDPHRVQQAVGQALEAYLASDAMAPFASRYDRFVRGEAQLTAAETRGMALFANPDKGNCASCHVFNPTSANPTRSLFTDYGYDAIAAPRNRALPANRDPAHYDLGLCETGTARGWPEAAQWCGYFKTPSLRNVATRSRFMHNGVFDSLQQVVEFYATRATDPDHWYPKQTTFDDLPASARGNVNINSVPYNRRVGMKPALDADEISAIVAFLRTLTDEPVKGAVAATAR